MLKLYISNHIDKLGDKLTDNIADTGNCFIPELMISQTAGMERWIALKASRNNGIFTNFRFMKPNSFINQLSELAELPVSEIYSTENLKWIIYELLGESEFIEQFPLVSGYYLNDDIKQLQLSVKLADLFDQYLLYRQDYISAWNAGKDATIKKNNNDSDRQHESKKKLLNKHQDWQKYLWVGIKNKVDSKDKVQLKEALQKKLQDTDFQNEIKKKWKRISLFGLSVITDYHTSIFYQLSQLIDVHLYFLNPSPDSYWYDNVNEKFVYYLEKKTGQTAEELKLHIGNELLSNYSALAKDTYNILFRNDDFINAIEEVASKEPSPESLLGKIQNDIFNNAHIERNPITESDLKDDSLIISSSYTIVREIEALYHQLLYFFDKDNTLEAHDIIVQVPDINAYTPYIQAVFDNAPYKLPYSIADRTYNGTDKLFGALEQVLELSFEDFTSTNIAHFLNSEIICQKFDIEDVDIIRQALKQANVKFGIEGYKKDDTRFVSWKYGFERLLLGYAVRSHSEFVLDGEEHYPLDTIEGTDMYHIFRFKAFVDKLISLIENRQLDRSIVEWGAYVLDLIDSLFYIDQSVETELKYIHKHIESFAKMQAWFSQKISFEVFKRSLLDALFSNPRSGNFINGNITFCSMIPMRSIPFKVLAVLGLNADAFPRKDSKTAFNLIDIEHRRGDRITKNNDKYLFLEHILSAQNNLYLSYIGNKVSDNSELSPSIVIENLKDYILSSYQGDKKEAEQDLIVRHPFHNYSRKYNSLSPRLFRYEKTQQDSKDINRTLVKDVEDVLSNIVEMNHLTRFFNDPFKYYYHHTLGVFLDEYSDELEETEIFELDSLQSYSIKEQMLFLDKTQEDKFILKAKINNRLPLANMAKTTFQDAFEEIEELKQKVEAYTFEKEVQNMSVDFEVQDRRFLAHITDIYDNKNLIFSVSSESSKAKLLLNAWIQHLYLMAGKQHIDTVLLTRFESAPIVFPHNMMTWAEARSLLYQLADIFESGQREILPFLPKEAYDFIHPSSSRKTEEQRLKDAVRSIQENGKTSNWRDYRNEYIAKEVFEGFFDDSERLYATFKSVAETVFSKV